MFSHADSWFEEHFIDASLYYLTSIVFSANRFFLLSTISSHSNVQETPISSLLGFQRLHFGELKISFEAASESGTKFQCSLQGEQPSLVPLSLVIEHGLRLRLPHGCSFLEQQNSFSFSNHDPHSNNHGQRYHPCQMHICLIAPLFLIADKLSA